ncbi:MAG: hypothetical protein AAFQ59_04840 [Pseudomonadota bacterium]
MNWLIYIGVVCFGATALLIEARRNYRESLTLTPFQRHPILQSAKVSDLCTDRDGFIGFLVYSLLYLVSYGVILSSAELYELVRNANLAKVKVGATGTFDPFGNDVLNLQGTAYAKPIFVSAFLIAIMSVGVMRPIENMVRSAAHRIAGIPRGVYRVIDALQTPEAGVICKTRKAGPLTAHYRATLRDTPSDKMTVDLYGRRDEIEKALTVIDALSVAVTPVRRGQFFPVAELEELSRMADELHAKYGDMTDALLAFDATSQESLVKLHTLATVHSENTKALFAVHYIRNNQSVKNLDHGTPLARIVDVIDRNYVPEKNSFALSAFVSLLMSVLIIFTIYSTWWAWSVETNEFVARAQIEDLIEADRANQAGGGAMGDQSLTLDACFANVRPERCDWIIEQGKRDFIFDIRPDLVTQSIWDAIQMALVTFAAAGAVIFGRDVRLEQESWKPGWSMHRMPFLRLLGLCVVPAILAFVFAIAGALMELTYDAGFSFDTGLQITNSQIITLLSDNLVYFAMMPFAGLAVGFSVLVIMDKHDDFSRIRTLLLLALPGALLIGLIVVVIIFVSYNYEDYFIYPDFSDNVLIPNGIGVSYKARDWLIMAVLPMLFVLLFAWFIELTEEPDEVEIVEDDAQPAVPAAKQLKQVVEEKAGTPPKTAARAQKGVA